MVKVLREDRQMTKIRSTETLPTLFTPKMDSLKNLHGVPKAGYWTLVTQSGRPEASSGSTETYILDALR